MADDKYDCALSALLAAGVKTDARGTTKRWADAKDDHCLETAFNMLPPELQERLAKNLPQT